MHCCSLSLSEGEEELSGSGHHQNPQTQPAPWTSTQSFDRNRCAPANQQKVTADPNASKATKPKRRTLRDRVIHLLALKPYSFKHLVRRLQRDGLTGQEHKALKSVLAEVGALSPLPSHETYMGASSHLTSV